MKKGAIFDMDGLMFDTEQIWQKNWTKISEEMGVDLDPQFRKEICGTSGALMNHVIEKYYHVEDGSGIAQDCKQRVQKDLETYVPEKKGIHEILAYLKANGAKIAVASSSTRGQIQRNLEHTGTAGYIDAICSGTEIEHGKPAPDLFLHAADLLGLKGEDCYVFEDAYNGVRAGHAAGACTVMVPDTQAPDEEMKETADAICDSLLDALDLIRQGKI